MDSTASLFEVALVAEAGGTSRKDAIAEVARRAGVPKRDVYDLVHKPGKVDKA